MAKTQIRLKAEEFFIENIEATNKEVAEMFKVSQNTVSNWNKKYNWEEKRLNFHASPTKIKQLLQQELLSIAGGNKAKLPADAISKLMATLERLEKKADPIVVHKILKDLDYFTSEIDPNFAKECIKFHKMFLQHRISLENG